MRIEKMKFRPCIDIHNGKVKQIVGGSLLDEGSQAEENFVSPHDATYFAKLYQKDGLTGGHVILLNAPDSPYFRATKEQAINALKAYPRGLQIGGGITADNAKEYLELGGEKVIVTSYIFPQGKFHLERLKKLVKAVGKERIVIDLSCRKKNAEDYYVVTNRWQTFSDSKISLKWLEELSFYAAEFLIHGVDVEGKSAGCEEDLVRLLAKHETLPITYAGGLGSLADLEKFKGFSGGKLDFTIGSALDIFGGLIPYKSVIPML